jgi:site-specific recombinase XerD
MARLLADADAEHLPWQAIRYQHAQALRTALAERYQPATVNKALSALRGVLREAWRLGLMTAEDYHRAADLAPVRGEALPRGRALTPGELAAILGTCSADPSPAGPRDAALLAILYGAGLRRSEAVALDLSDYDRETGSLTIRQGKGHKDRIVYATNGAAHALSDWLSARSGEAGALFVPVNRGGRIGTERMTAQAVMLIVQKRAKQAGVAHVTPHDLRRTMISHLLDAGADIVVVQKLAGHANVDTTARYDRRGEREKRRAAELLHVPYSGRA